MGDNVEFVVWKPIKEFKEVPYVWVWHISFWEIIR